MTKLNKALMASTAIAFASGLAFPASAQDPAAAPGVVASQKKVKVTLYGQIAKVFGVVGDGETETFKVGENGNTATRMGLDGRGKMTNDISVRTRLEFGVQSGNTGGGSQFVNQEGAASRFTVRHLDLILSSKKFGAIWIGRGDTASNGTAEASTLGAIDTGRLGGTTASLIGSYRVLNENENLATRDLGSVGSFFNNFDGADRSNRIRYDTPTFFGFRAGASFIDKHNFDTALWYNGKIAGTTVKGAVGFCHTRGGQSAGGGSCFGNGTTITAVTQVDGSVSVLTPIGLGGAFSAGHQRRALSGAGHTNINSTAYNIVPSIYYTMKATEVGATTIEYAFQYCESCSTSFKDSEGIGHSLMLMQQVDSVGGDYFVTFRYFDIDTGVAGQDADGLWFFGGGFRQRF
jgi:predicted porin